MTFHLHARPNPTKFSVPTAPKCPTCNRSVYAAEQVLGPGSTPYHKSCLKCKHCTKTLDSSNVFEHGYDPYCKLCHAKNFGIKGVGYGNVLVGEYRLSETASNASTSPNTNNRMTPISPLAWSSKNNPSSPSPTRFSRQPMTSSSAANDPEDFFRTENENAHEKKSSPSLENDAAYHEFEYDDSFEPPSLDTLRIIVNPKLDTTPRSRGEEVDEEKRNQASPTNDRRLPETYRRVSMQSDQATGLGHISTPPHIPPKPTLFNSRISSSNSSPNTSMEPPARFRTDGSQKCPSCLETVYHAEQVLAIGKKWHKRCLRCWTCKRALDSNLNERSGKPYCVKCYDHQFGSGAHGFVLRAGFTGK